MSKNRAELVISIANNLGTKFRELSDSTRIELAKFEGMYVSAIQFMNMLMQQSKNIEIDVNSNKFNQEMRDYVLQHNKSLMDSTSATIKQLEANIHICKGKLNAFEIVMKEIEATVVSEKNKIKVIEYMDANGLKEFDGPLHSRPPGIRPADPLESRRINSADAKAEDSSADLNSGTVTSS